MGLHIVSSRFCLEKDNNNQISLWPSSAEGSEGQWKEEEEQYKLPTSSLLLNHEM